MFKKKTTIVSLGVKIEFAPSKVVREKKIISRYVSTVALEDRPSVNSEW